jgi:hypothetical protein
MMRRLLGVLLIIVGAAAVSACLRSAYDIRGQHQ